MLYIFNFNSDARDTYHCNNYKYLETGVDFGQVLLSDVEYALTEVVTQQATLIFRKCYLNNICVFTTKISRKSVTFLTLFSFAG